MSQSRKLRLSTVSSGMTYGGAQRIIIDLHDVMPDFIDPEVVGIYPGEMMKFIEERGIRNKEFNFRGKATPLAIPALVKHFKKTRPDIVITHLPKADVVGRIASRIAGVPLVLSVCHNMEEWRENNTLNNIDVLTSKLNDGVICISEAAKKNLISFGMNKDIIRVSHGRGELRTRFADPSIPEETRAAYRKEFAIDESTLVSIMVGRFYPQKAHEVALRALRMLEKRAPKKKHVLLMAGDGPLREKMESYAKKLLKPESYRFLGNRDDIAGLLAFADLFVMSSRWEGTPIALQEAFASGLPAVVSEIPSQSEVIDDCQGALTFPTEDHKGLAKQWRRILDDDALRASLSKKGRENALAHWDIRNLRDEYFKFIAQLALKSTKMKEVPLPQELLDYQYIDTFCPSNL